MYTDHSSNLKTPAQAAGKKTYKKPSLRLDSPRVNFAPAFGEVLGTGNGCQFRSRAWQAGR